MIEKRTVKTMPKKLTGASFGILGDSYSTFKDHIPEGNRCYYPNTEKVDDVLQVDQTWWHLLMTRNDMQLIINDSYSGATVCTHTRDTQPFSSAFVERAKVSFSGDLPLDYIVLFGGTNDNWLGRTTGQVQFADWTESDLREVLPAYCFILDYLTKHNPQSQVIAVLNSGFDPALHSGMVSAATHFGAKVVELENISKQTGHPTALGMTQIAQQIQAVL